MRTKYPGSIKTRLVTLIAFLISAISLFVYLYFPSKIESQLKEALIDKVTTLARISSYSVGAAVLFEDKDAAAEQLAPLLRNDEVQYAIIDLENGNLFFHHNLEIAEKLGYITTNENYITTDNQSLKVKVKIQVDDDLLGNLYIGYSLKKLQNEVIELKSNIKNVSLVIFIVGILFALYIGFVITKPITKMVDIVEKIRNGNLSIRAPIFNNDEIGYLAKSFNSMVDRIEDSNLEMESINKELEKRVEERTSELKDAKEKAEAAVKMKTEFLAQMSHEIRTPINSILSYTQLLKDETFERVPEDLRFSFDMINSGGRRLIRTVDLILNMSELQTGTYELIIEKFNIADILKDLTGEFQTAANTKKLDLMFINRLDKDESVMEADIYTVTQIFANLIDNAIKYTVEGSIEVVVYKTKENQIAIDVQDTGIGISEKFQKMLFDPFTQEEQGYTRKFDGNGLGMALVKEYCKLNNAKITLQSEKGKGSTFTVIFSQIPNSNNENLRSVVLENKLS